MTKKAGCLKLLSISKAKEELSKLKDKDKFERMIQVAGILTELLEKHNIRPIIVGGLSVEIYTQQQYTTYDIDFIINGSQKAGDLLFELGFEKIGKDWIHHEVGLSIEIPDHILAGDYQKVTSVPIANNRTIYVIGIEDIILDRLRAAVHWKSGEDREWGYRLFYMYFEEIDIPYIESQLKTQEEKEEFHFWKNEIHIEKS